MPTTVAQPFPLALFAFSVILFTFNALVQIDVAATQALTVPTTGAPSVSSDTGGFVTLIGNIVSFHYDGMPWWLQYPLVIITYAPWVYLLIAVAFSLLSL